MKFGVREICNVVFKTTSAGQTIGDRVFKKAGMPAFMIDTAKTSSLEQASTTVYAQGGRGNNRLIAWEGEKTLTFTLEDALISPMGLAVLSGAGLISPSQTKPMHVHCTIDAEVKVTGTSPNEIKTATVTLDDLKRETGLGNATSFAVCASTSVPSYATKLDGSGAGIVFFSDVTVGKESGETDVHIVNGDGTEGTKAAVFTIVDTPTETDKKTVPEGKTLSDGDVVQLDFYLVMSQGVQEIEIKPEDFGGYFYIEAQTLFRREDSGKDMAAEIILPKVKVQSGFTFTMASSGDPSTFTFTMDAFPGYTQFDKTKKVMCIMQVIGTDDYTSDDTTTHTHTLSGQTPEGL